MAILYYVIILFNRLLMLDRQCNYFLQMKTFLVNLLFENNFLKSKNIFKGFLFDDKCIKLYQQITSATLYCQNKSVNQ